MPRSGEFYASNDYLICELLNDPKYFVTQLGSIYRLKRHQWVKTGQAVTDKNGKSYHHLKYRGSNLLVHRIIYRKFVGRLASDLVVNHIDGNSLNNLPSNLALCSQTSNMRHAHAG